jgi:hypothetical protein
MANLSQPSMVNLPRPQSWSGRLRIPPWRNVLPVLLKSILILIGLLLLATAAAAISVMSVATCLHPERALGPLKSLAEWSTSCQSLSEIQTRKTQPPAPAAKGAKKR